MTALNQMIYLQGPFSSDRIVNADPEEGQVCTHNTATATRSLCPPAPEDTASGTHDPGNRTAPCFLPVLFHVGH